MNARGVVSKLYLPLELQKHEAAHKTERDCIFHLKKDNTLTIDSGKNNNNPMKRAGMFHLEQKVKPWTWIPRRENTPDGKGWYFPPR